MKFKEWFSISAVRSEMKNVTWLTKKELAKNSATVIAFCLVMGAFFFFGDAIIAGILKVLGMN